MTIEPSVSNVPKKRAKVSAALPFCSLLCTVLCLDRGSLLLTPLLSKERYIELGYQMAIYPATGFLAVGKALQSVYTQLRDFGASTGCSEELADFKGFCKTMGFERVWEFDKAHADIEEEVQEQILKKRRVT